MINKNNKGDESHPSDTLSSYLKCISHQKHLEIPKRAAGVISLVAFRAAWTPACQAAIASLVGADFSHVTGLRIP